MAQRNPSIECEGIPLDKARRMSRGPRMDPELYPALRGTPASVDHTATRITLSDGTCPNTVQNRIARIATDRGVPVTLRRLSGGLICWRSTVEDLQQTRQVVARLQSTQQPPQAAPRGRRWRGPRST